MDPFSITASAASLVQLCMTIVSALKFVRDASNVESVLHSLREEIDTLGRVLSRVGQTFDASPMKTPFQRNHEIDLRHLLDRCGNLLETLHQIISGLEGRKRFGSNLLKQIRLNRVTQDITILKANIHSCSEMLQVSLMAISITMHQEHQSSFGDMSIQLKELYHAISEVKISLLNRNYQGFGGGPLQLENPLIHDVKNCLVSVELEMDINGFKYEPKVESLALDGASTQEDPPGHRNSGDSQARSINSVSGDGILDNKETLDWLRKNSFSTEKLDVSRREAVRLAVKEGQVAVLQVLVNQVSNSQARKALLADAMQLAISTSQLHILQSLITTKAGPSINCLLGSGHTPLVTAIITGNHQIVELLLLHDADTEVMCADQTTPLTHAVKARDQGIVQLLLRRNALVDATTWDWTPLHFAVDCGDRDMVELLLNSNADIEASCPREFSQKKDTQAADLRRSVTVDSTAEIEPYCTPLFRASINADDMMVQLLLERGANTEAKNSGQATALICAAEEQFEEIVDLLLRNNASVNARDKWNWTPLHRAQVKQESELVTKMLLDYKAEIDARCEKNRTSLHWAAEWGNTLTVPILLKHKADIEAKDGAGRTPLHIAIEYRQTEMVIQLVERGADVTARDSEGHDALAAADHVERQRRCPEIIAYLREEHVQSGTGFRRQYPLT